MSFIKNLIADFKLLFLSNKKLKEKIMEAIDKCEYDLEMTIWAQEFLSERRVLDADMNEILITSIENLQDNVAILYGALEELDNG